MSRWPSFNLNFGTKAPSPPVDDGVEELPDFYRMLDPLFTSKKRDYGGVYPRYRDEEGVLHHPTYRPFPPLVPPPRKLPPDERPTYVERMRLPPPEELPPTDPVPKIPPWKQRPRPEPKKKLPKQQSRKSKAIKRASANVEEPESTVNLQGSVTIEESEGQSPPGAQSTPSLMGAPVVQANTEADGEGQSQ
ncbi:hypothetical protein D9756_010523 [Leucocoprinus leucothites]|uniref:Uncharacterized protein n=1 Tax=Leucocoprinus leucothites TaxID=201217 RepID=A0A8H5FSP6_9AGAR|nr:hypothetical protein D9756_010523 [Leucoagaricus leucothites]